MRTIMPFSVRIVILTAITFLISSCSEESKQVTGDNISSPRHTTSNIETDNIADGKPIIEFDSSNYSTVTFKYGNSFYVVAVSDDIPSFSQISADSRADIEITDSNEFLNFNDRAYAIIVDGGLRLSAIY